MSFSYLMLNSRQFRSFRLLLMSLTDPGPERIRFGEFELNLRTRELRTNGQTKDLQEQPFVVLTALLERPGQLILREQLIERLWPADTHVDFEHSLNKAVKRLRKALKDSADQPRFVETLPRRGYRFIGRITVVSEAKGVSPSTLEGVASEPPVDEVAPVRRLRVAAIAALILAGVAGFALIWMGVRRNQATHAGVSPVSIHSLAVLPLENLSGEASQEYFADGMTDELITDLGQIGSLRVISRTSAMQYKKAHKSLKQIAGELNVDAVVEGTVLRAGDRVRISAQLIEAPSDRHLWAQSYEGEAKDALGLQNQVARAIAEQIRAKLTPEQRAALNATPTVNPAAHDMYLKGLYERNTVEGRARAIEDLKRAAELDPNYAAVQVAIARQYMSMGHMLALPPQKAFPAAIEAVHKALDIDGSSADAHLLAGYLAFLYEWDFPKAEREILRGMELNPNLAIGYGYYADWLLAMGKVTQGVETQRRRAELDPLSVGPRGSLSGILYLARRYEEAITEARAVLAIDENNFDGQLGLGLSLESKKEYAAAIREIERAQMLWEDRMWMGFAAHARAVSGDRVGAQKALAELDRQSKHAYVSPWWSAMIYTGLGDKDKAFEYLEKSYRGREHDLAYSKAWPQFDPLHSDPRWADLMRRVGLPE